MWRLTKGNKRSVGRLRGMIYVPIVFILVVFGCLSQPSVTNGEERIKISVRAGFNNEIKEHHWVPVRVTLTNHGAPLEGSVFVQLNDGGYSEWAGTAEEYVELPQGATKEVTLVLPSERLQAGQKVVFASEGKKAAEAKITANWVGSDTLSVGVLASSDETGRFLSGLAHMDMSVFPLTSEELPEVGIALSGLDVLVFNNYSAETLNANQVEAIKRWVAAGGVLILGGGPEYKKAGQAFQELSPVDVTGTTTVDAIRSLQQKASGAELAFESPLTLSKATLKSEAKALVAEDDLPIIATRSWQEGKVIYTAYNLTVAPLNDWQGNAPLWENILSNSRSNVVQSSYHSHPWSLMEAVNYIPSLQLPSIGIIVLAFLIYVLIVGPIVYLVLRRWDKRSWAWGVIPLSAVLVAIGIYAYGTGVRGNNVMVHNVNVLKIHRGGAAELRGAIGLFVPDGGTYDLQLPQAVTGWPAKQDFSPSDPSDTDQNRVRITPDGTDITFKNVEFWSMRRAYVEGQVDIGQVVADLSPEGDRLVGTVTNKSSLDLYDVHLLSGDRMREIGTLKAGATKEVDVEHGSPSYSSGGYAYEQFIQFQDGYEREDGLLRYVQYEAYPFMPSQSEVQLVGWTEQPVYESSVNNEPSEQHSLSLVIVPLHVKAGADGTVVWPKGAVLPDVVMVNGSFAVEPDGFNVGTGKGSVTFRFDLDLEEKVHLDQLEVETQGAGDHIEWLNQQTGEWEEIHSASSKTSLNHYLSASGEVLVRLSWDKGNDEYYPFPTLEAEGTVVK